ncbi:MAG: hypothetical protein CMF74_01960 [Maricaulis sp.]|jgi:TolB-like protein/tetratricopeptide (TPR) repeat protein|nr:hypothetical protein [Maricaulis sp.]HAQ34381.1 hypothetical protein [Alphaproteobacteria bacterium]
MFRFIQELRRRSVFRVAAGYLVASWLILQVVAAVEEAAGLPPWADGAALILLIAGFPLAIFLSWAFELTPEGLKPTPALSAQDGVPRKPVRAVDVVLFSALTIVCGLVVWQLVSRPAFLTGSPTGDTVSLVTPAGETPAPVPDLVAPELSVAVLPFVAFSSSADDGFIADGLTEEILNSLAAVPELLVTSRTSAFQFRGPDLPSVPEIAQSLGVAHVLEGSIRRSGEQLRVTVQLIRASDDRHLWSETFDRTDRDVFAIQEEIAENVARVMEIVLNEDQRRRMRNSGTRSFDAYLAYQQALGLWVQAHQEGDFTLLDRADPLFATATSEAPDFFQAYLLQSDRNSHRMLDLSEGGEAIDPDTWSELAEERSALLDAADEAAETQAQRSIVQANRLVFSQDWSNLYTAIGDSLAGEGCVNDNWLQTLIPLYPDLDARLAYANRLVTCDPLNPEALLFHADTLIARGDYEAALLAAERLHAVEQYGESEYVQIHAYLGLGRHADAESLIAENWDWERFRIRAHMGDREAVDAEYEEMASYDDWTAIIASAVAGRREAANAVAARMDARPLGAVTLLDAAIACLCGAPFDLEAAPNFAAMIERTGLDWPIAGDLNFPLMDD